MGNGFRVPPQAGNGPVCGVPGPRGSDWARLPDVDGDLRGRRRDRHLRKARLVTSGTSFKERWNRQVPWGPQDFACGPHSWSKRKNGFRAPFLVTNLECWMWVLVIATSPLWRLHAWCVLKFRQTLTKHSAHCQLHTVTTFAPFTRLLPLVTQPRASEVSFLF